MSTPAAPATTQHYRFFHNEASTEETSRILEADPKSVEYDLFYFDFSCVAATPRYILSYGKAKWHDQHPKVNTHRVLLHFACAWFEDKSYSRDSNHNILCM